LEIAMMRAVIGALAARPVISTLHFQRGGAGRDQIVSGRA